MSVLAGPKRATCTMGDSQDDRDNPYRAPMARSEPPRRTPTYYPSEFRFAMRVLLGAPLITALLLLLKWLWSQFVS